uniref:Uncharacterized protein n=1 Tax=Anser brachyrhynchus TaxID=132585 RepID=A0A8B9CLE8_9AVES
VLIRCNIIYLICTGKISKGRSAGQVIPHGASVCLPFKCHFSSILFPLLSIGRKWLRLSRMSVLGFLLVATAFLAVFTEDFSLVLSECKSG